MEKRIKSYRKYMDELLSQLEAGKEAAEPSQLKEEHLTQIAFFQHERLIHLIVTVTFALLEFLSILLFMFFPGISTGLLVLVVLILLVPYIRHYYILENEVQRMYGQYDRLCALMSCD